MKKLYVILGLNVVIWVAGWIINHDSTGKGPDRAGAKLDAPDVRPPAIAEDRIHAIEIADADNRVKVQRLGEAWTLPEKFDVPVMGTKPEDLLKAFAGVERSTIVSRSPESLKDRKFGLDAASAKHVTFRDENDKVVADVWVGGIDLSGGRTLATAGNFLRFEGIDAVYSHKARLHHLVTPILSMWLDGRLFRVDPSELDKAMNSAERVTVEFDDIPLAGSQPAAETRPDRPPRIRLTVVGAEPAAEAEEPDVGPKPAQPRPPGRKTRDWTFVEPQDLDFKPQGGVIEQMVRNLLHARGDDVVSFDPTLTEFGLDNPFLEVEVGFSDGTTRRLRVGATAPAPVEPTRRGGTYRYANVDGDARVYLVNEQTLHPYRKKPEELKASDSGTRVAPSPGAPIQLPEDK